MGIATAQLAALDDRGLGLRVVFTKQGDRWQHRVERIDGAAAAAACVLQSREGSPSDDWPASPPFQELSQETLPDGRAVLFLVGRCGTSHWSASVETAANPPQLIFDIACRHSQAPRQLGSAYARLTDDIDIQALLGEAHDGVIVPEAITTRLPGTTRWKYRVTDTRRD